MKILSTVPIPYSPIAEAIFDIYKPKLPEPHDIPMGSPGTENRIDPSHTVAAHLELILAGDSVRRH